MVYRFDQILTFRRHPLASTWPNCIRRIWKNNKFEPENMVNEYYMICYLWITYGSGYPLALHVNVILVPSRTTISLLVIVSTMIGGTELNEKPTIGNGWGNFQWQTLTHTAFVNTYRQLEDTLCVSASDLFWMWIENGKCGQDKVLSPHRNRYKWMNGWLTGVYLTHIPSSVIFFDFFNVQIPRSMIVVCQTNSMILCD